MCPVVQRVGLLLVGLFRDDCCVIILVFRAVRAGVAFMNAAHVSHGDIVLDCEQAP